MNYFFKFFCSLVLLLGNVQVLYSMEIAFQDETALSLADGAQAFSSGTVSQDSPVLVIESTEIERALAQRIASFELAEQQVGRLRQELTMAEHFYRLSIREEEDMLNSIEVYGEEERKKKQDELEALENKIMKARTELASRLAQLAECELQEKAQCEKLLRLREHLQKQQREENELRGLLRAHNKQLKQLNQQIKDDEATTREEREGLLKLKGPFVLFTEYISSLF